MFLDFLLCFRIFLCSVLLWSFLFLRVCYYADFTILLALPLLLFVTWIGWDLLYLALFFYTTAASFKCNISTYELSNNQNEVIWKIEYQFYMIQVSPYIIKWRKFCVQHNSIVLALKNHCGNKEHSTVYTIQLH